MPTDRPSAEEILQAIDQFLLEKVAPQLEPHSRFHLKVTSNLLRLLQREFKQRDSLNLAELQRLQKLLNSDDQDLAALNQELCDAIRTGTLGLDHELLKSHLKATARSKLEIDNPRYLAGR